MNTTYLKIKDKKRVVLLLIATITIGTISCKKLIEVDPPINSVIGSEIYKTDATAASVLTGIYTLMGGQFTNLSVRMGVYSDEFGSIEDATISPIYRNDILKDDGGLLFWKSYYESVFYINSAIEGLTASTTLSPSVKNRLLGEAKFLRAFFYFYLVNLYGDVPLLLNTNPEVNRLAARDNQEKVYQQIIADLKESQSLINGDFLDGALIPSSGDRRRPSKAAATALLARVYLYHKDWSLAEAEASKVISDGRFTLDPLDQTFLIASKEAIWQLQLTDIALNTTEARYFVLKGTDQINQGPDNRRPVYLSKNVYDRFESHDQRKVIWADTIQKRESGTGSIQAVFPFPYKYKAWLENQPRTEYVVVMRLAEQYLIRAEARAQLGNLGGAADDMFEIRNRAGLNRVSFASTDDAVNKVLNERRSELFSEFAHRWFDLKRTGKLNQVMNEVTPIKGGIWQDYKALLPIPIPDFQTNPNFRGHQNPGYLEN